MARAGYDYQRLWDNEMLTHWTDLTRPETVAQYFERVKRVERADERAEGRAESVSVSAALTQRVQPVVRGRGHAFLYDYN